MRLCNLRFEEAMSQHPQGVDDIIKAYRASRSKDRFADANALTWTYQIWVSVPTISFRDFLEGKAKPKIPAKSRDEWVAGLVSRTTSFLVAETGRMSRGVRVPNPPEVRVFHESGWDRIHNP